MKIKQYLKPPPKDLLLNFEVFGSSLVETSQGALTKHCWRPIWRVSKTCLYLPASVTACFHSSCGTKKNQPYFTNIQHWKQKHDSYNGLDLSKDDRKKTMDSWGFLTSLPENMEPEIMGRVFQSSLNCEAPRCPSDKTAKLESSFMVLCYIQFYGEPKEISHLLNIKEIWKSRPKKGAGSCCALYF